MKHLIRKLDPKLLAMRNINPKDLIQVNTRTEKQVTKAINAVHARVNKASNQKIMKQIIKLHNKGSYDNASFAQLYSLVDKYVEAVIKPSSVCQKGCGQCCHVNTDVSYPEALYIAANTRRDINFSPKSRGDNERCTFLGDDMSCTIYEYRPLVCRTFHAVDNWEECYIKGNPHHIFGIGSSVVIAELQKHLSNTPNDYLVGYTDINGWFN
ncbi:YkgJ family cysteine cluster protein [Vibrio alginolyticus]|uniref:YkgJ family cysteine cluster protein n=1 Tax=Vibrio TaxID=662 RepID=UPI0006CAA2BE|nr:YkgJ family cysteine cluster protein [Vibrio alginolyticus]